METERLFDKVMNRTIQIRNIRLTVLDILFVLAVFILSLQGRMVLFPKESGDYVSSLAPWMAQIREKGGLASLGHEISNYSSAYMIIMSLLSYIDAETLYLLKGVSVGFDYAAAIAVFLILHRLTGSERKGILGMAALLFTPTVILNGSYWGQCDMIYVTFLLYGIYFLCRGNSNKALWMVAFGFAFKLQALFILPFFIMMWLCPYVKTRDAESRLQLVSFLVLPVPYLLLTLPGIFMGRDIWNSIGVYFAQTGYYPQLTLNYPNLYGFFGQTYLSEYSIPELGSMGVCITIAVMGCLAYYLYAAKARMSGDLMITTALFSLSLVIYCLPYMHERYGMPVDVLAVLYGAMRPKRIPVVIGLIASSMISYMPFLFGKEGLSLIPHALLQLILIITVGMDWYRQIYRTRIQSGRRRSKNS